MLSLGVYVTSGLTDVTIFLFNIYILFNVNCRCAGKCASFTETGADTGQKCNNVSLSQEHSGIVSIVTIPHIVVCQNMNYTFMAILQPDNAILSCVEDLFTPTFPRESEKRLKETGI